jgi:hypothetical protein
MAVAVLHSAPVSPNVGRIEFGPTLRAKGGWAGPATVAHNGEEWAVELDMIDAYTSDMVGFFEEMAQERRVWGGVKHWSSEYSEITLEAANPGHGVVAISFSLWWSRGDPLDNEREGEPHIRADELPVFAAQIRKLTGLRGEARRFRLAR